jgi:hypothetical protein
VLLFCIAQSVESNKLRYLPSILRKPSAAAAAAAAAEQDEIRIPFMRFPVGAVYTASLWAILCAIYMQMRFHVRHRNATVLRFRARYYVQSNVEATSDTKSHIKSHTKPLLFAIGCARERKTLILVAYEIGHGIASTCDHTWSRT